MDFDDLMEILRGLFCFIVCCCGMVIFFLGVFIVIRDLWAML
nr:MAG TPA: hypothetical protein [Caudoviricetes sp.]